MSHVEAISRGIPEGKEHIVQIIKLNEREDVYQRESNELNLESIESDSVKHVFLSIGGNFYNIFGLIDNPIPFKVLSKNATSVTLDDSRMFVPHQMMVDHFKVRLQRLLKHIPIIQQHFLNAKIYHLCSPPPVESSEHITKFPGIFGSRMAQGITPSSLRKVFYDIQTDIYVQECSALNIKVISPPRESTDKNGFLKPCYRNNDPTHANKGYGSLVWSQIEAQINA